VHDGGAGLLAGGRLDRIRLAGVVPAAALVRSEFPTLTPGDTPRHGWGSDGGGFACIARALAWLDDQHGGQPTLQGLANAAGVSPSHFGRLFHQWAGITPGNYLQSLNGATSKASLLQGPRRAPHLVVTLQGMVPEQSGRDGAGLTLTCGIAQSPFGWLLSAETPRGLGYLGFVGSSARDAASALLHARWPAARLQWEPAAAAALATLLWGGADRSPATIRLCVQATPFQLAVWQALLAVRPAETTSYLRLAVQAGAPAAARAVGGAVGANPIAWLIPCHRVLRADGALGGYHWGPERKRAMLVWERLR